MNTVSTRAEAPLGEAWEAFGRLAAQALTDLASQEAAA